MVRRINAILLHQPQYSTKALIALRTWRRQLIEIFFVFVELETEDLKMY